MYCCQVSIILFLLVIDLYYVLLLILSSDLIFCCFFLQSILLFVQIIPWQYIFYLFLLDFFLGYMWIIFFFSLAFLYLSVNWCFSMISIHFSHIFSLLLCGGDLSKASVAKLKSLITFSDTKLLWVLVKIALVIFC